jgi:hypothetical protein
MIARFLRLWPVVREWTKLPGNENWIQVMPCGVHFTQLYHVVAILHPFHRFTQALSQTSQPGISLVWKIYDDLFNHLDEVSDVLLTGSVPWKLELISAIKKGRDKLSFYYGATEEERGTLYNLGTILNPRIKTSLYDQAHWGEEFKRSYETEFLSYYKQHYAEQEIPGAAYNRFKAINTVKTQDIVTNLDDVLFSTRDHDRHKARFEVFEGYREKNEAQLYLLQNSVNHIFII